MVDFLKLETEADLQRIIDEGIEESLVLDYKDSRALSKDKVTDICKDVSAFANSAGGQIVYGIEEKGDKPVKIDQGADGELLNREWLENTLLTRIQPKIDGLHIQPIRLDSGGTAYVVTIPQAGPRAPHQANDRYYRRFNFVSVPMADYEIRDIMKRASTPDLTCDMLLTGTDAVKIEFRSVPGQSNVLTFTVEAQNHSPAPAHHVVATAYVDDRLYREPGASFAEAMSEPWSINGATLRGLSRVMTPAFALPIFQEHPQRLGQFMVRLVSYQTEATDTFYVGVKLFWPGGTFAQLGKLTLVEDRIYFQLIASKA